MRPPSIHAPPARGELARLPCPPMSRPASMPGQRLRSGAVNRFGEGMRRPPPRPEMNRKKRRRLAPQAVAGGEGGGRRPTWTPPPAGRRHRRGVWGQHRPRPAGGWAVCPQEPLLRSHNASSGNGHGSSGITMARKSIRGVQGGIPPGERTCPSKSSEYTRRVARRRPRGGENGIRNHALQKAVEHGQCR